MVTPQPPTYTVVTIEDVDSPVMEMSPDTTELIHFQFSWRGLWALMKRGRRMTVGVTMLDTAIWTGGQDDNTAEPA
jgi:hypothetical protein